MELPKSSHHLTSRKKHKAASTVGRGKTVKLNQKSTISEWNNSSVSLNLGNSLDYYKSWEKPIVIISDGGYGILGFEGDTSELGDMGREIFNRSNVCPDKSAKY